MAAETVDIKDIDPERIMEALSQGRRVHYQGRQGPQRQDWRTAPLLPQDPPLIEAALEASELALDKAEAQVFRALRTGQLSNRLQAAAFVVRSRGRGR